MARGEMALRISILGGAAALVMASSPVGAQETTGQGDEAVAPPIDITQSTCRDLLRAPGDEEENILVFFHGYLSGRDGVTLIDVAAFQATSEAVIDDCIEAPDMLLLDAFAARR